MIAASPHVPEARISMLIFVTSSTKQRREMTRYDVLWWTSAHYTTLTGYLRLSLNFIHFSSERIEAILLCRK